MRKRFLRKSRDKVIGGVCSGLADYVGADVTLVRLVTLFGIIASGIFPGVLLYLICLIIVPLDSNVGGGYYSENPGHDGFDGSGYQGGYEESSNPSSNNTRYIVGLGLIIVGLIIILRMFFAWIDWRYVFAGILILGGLYLLIGAGRRDGR